MGIDDGPFFPNASGKVCFKHLVTQTIVELAKLLKLPILNKDGLNL